MSEQNVVLSQTFSIKAMLQDYMTEDTKPQRAIEFADIISLVYMEQIIRLQH